MQNGYNIRWTDLALQELKDPLQYLEEEFTEKEITKLANEMERVVTLISQNPDIFPISEKINVRKAVILKFNTIFYRLKNKEIHIISFFNNRKNPEYKKF